jgi:4'-phosphopantetheinyl transferase
MQAVEPLLICRWPERPALPPPGRAVLVQIATPQPREAARHKLREVLVQVLSAWSSLPSEELLLKETPCGPVWQGEICGESLDISLSYGTEEGWVGLIRGGRIGVDVTVVTKFAEMDSVAQYYLGDLIAADIRRAANPTHAFAAAWTERESRIKCLKRNLVEWTAAQAESEAQCLCHNLVFNDALVGAVSWRIEKTK